MKTVTEIQQQALKISFSNGEWHGKVLGNGPKKMIFFHGFGQSPDDSLPLAMILPEYTLFSLELPFHGLTKINNKLTPLSPNQIIELIIDLKKQFNFEKYSIAGFSIGTKLVFPLVAHDDPALEEVLLIAPDGIKESLLYRFATGTKLSRGLFFQITQSKKCLGKLITLGMGLKILDKRTGIFVRKTMSDQARQKMVFDTWCFLRRLKLKPQKLAHALNSSGKKVTFVLGTEDQIITKSSIKPLASKLNNYDLIEIIGGHHDLIKKYVQSL